MKKKIRKLRCENCHDLFMPNRHHLKTKIMPQIRIQLIRKKNSHGEWLKKLKNRDYFSCPENVSRVQH